MSPLLVPLASLFFFSGFAVAQVSAPDCSSGWEWSFNSLGQNPCTVGAYMLATCSGGSFTIDALQSGYQYYGPSSADHSNLCKCSTVGYSLLSACGGCQGAGWISWSEYSLNCTSPLPPPSSFPNPVPAGTRVPHWALLDVTKGNLWDSDKSSADDSHDLGPGTVLGPSHSSNAGVIAAGVVGGIAVLFTLVVAVIFFLRRRRSLAPSAASAGDGTLNSHKDQVPRPMSDHKTVAKSFPSLMKTYNPDDPTTFPRNQGTPNSPFFPSQVPFSSSSRNVYTVAAMPGPSPQSRGYHGLPVV